MKRISYRNWLVFLFVVFLHSACAIPAFAFLPPQRLPLAEEVKRSSHIFIGEIKDFYFVDEAGRKLTAEQSSKWAQKEWLNPVVEYKLRVRQSLLTRGQRLPQYVLFRFWILGSLQGRLSEIEAIRTRILKQFSVQERENLNRSFVFLTSEVNTRGRRIFYSASNGCFFGMPLYEKAAVVNAIDVDKKQHDARLLLRPGR